MPRHGLSWRRVVFGSSCVCFDATTFVGRLGTFLISGGHVTLMVGYLFRSAIHCKFWVFYSFSPIHSRSSKGRQTLDWTGPITLIILLWTPAQRKRASMLYFANVYLFIFFLWPPYSPALVNGSSRKFYTWWTLSGIREVTTWIFSW